MTGPPPEDLTQWSTDALVREVERLRRITYAIGEAVGDDPRPHSEPGTIGEGGRPYGVHDTPVDARRATLLDNVNVTLVDTMRRDGEQADTVCLLTLGGRVNYAHDRIEHAYLFGPDGAAALVSELIHLAIRAARVGHGDEYAIAFRSLLTERMDNMPPD